METNPFESQDSLYHVLVNDEGQYSVWPEMSAVPAGWTCALTGVARAEALEYIETHWVDMRSRSLVSEMTARERAAG